MKNKNYKNFNTLIILKIFFIVLFFGCSNKKESVLEDNNFSIQKANNKKEESKDTEKMNEMAIESPPFTEGIFPCIDCHVDLVPNPTRRELIDMHDDISAIFDHDSENRWCLDCHDINNRNFLKLASGKLISFDESYKLCGQCHGDKLRDWKVGVHGRRTGDWNGKKEYFLCVSCHNPHSPKFQRIKPEPPPFPPDNSNN